MKESAERDEEEESRKLQDSRLKTGRSVDATCQNEVITIHCFLNRLEFGFYCCKPSRIGRLEINSKQAEKKSGKQAQISKGPSTVPKPLLALQNAKVVI